MRSAGFRGDVVSSGRFAHSCRDIFTLVEVSPLGFITFYLSVLLLKACMFVCPELDHAPGSVFNQTDLGLATDISFYSLTSLSDFKKVVHNI